MAVAAFMATLTVSAQSDIDDPRHQIAVSYGFMSNSNWIDAFENLGGAFVGSRAENDKFIGPISVEYFYRLNNPLINVGAIVAYGQLKEDLVNGLNEGKMTTRYYTLMPGVKFDWFRRECVSMYSKVAAGITYRDEKIDRSGADRDNYTDTGVHFNWQLTGFGVEFGSPNIRGFVEGGVGEQGMFLAGLRFRFD